MAAPRGNRNAAKEKRWAGALRRALAEYESADCRPGQALHLIAKKVVELAVDGNWDAIGEIGNREDGKPSQSVDMNISDDRTDRISIAQELAGLRAELIRRRDGRGTGEDTGLIPGSVADIGAEQDRVLLS